MLVTDLTSPKQQDWLRFMKESARRPHPALGVDIALDVSETFDIIYKVDRTPLLIYGAAAVVQTLLLGTKVVPGSWWVSDWGSYLSLRLGGTNDSDAGDDMLKLMQDDSRIVDGSESIRIETEGLNRLNLQAEFVLEGLLSAFTLYLPIRSN